MKKRMRDSMFECAVNTLSKVNDNYTRGELCCAIGGALAYLRTVEYIDECIESEERREESEKSEEERREEERRREWWGEVRKILRETRECRRLNENDE